MLPAVVQVPEIPKAADPNALPKIKLTDNIYDIRRAFEEVQQQVHEPNSSSTLGTEHDQFHKTRAVSTYLPLHHAHAPLLCAARVGLVEAHHSFSPLLVGLCADQQEQWRWQRQQWQRQRGQQSMTRGHASGGNQPACPRKSQRCLHGNMPHAQALKGVVGSGLHANLS